MDLILRPWRFDRNEISIAARLCSPLSRRAAHRAALELVAHRGAPLLSPCVVDLDGLTAVTLHVRFAPVSGGTTCKAWVQTSLDQGQTWADIFCAAFTTTAGFKIVNLSGLTPRTTVLAPTDAALADDTAVDGVLGDRLRLKITSTGTFGSGSVISARVAC